MAAASLSSQHSQKLPDIAAKAGFQSATPDRALTQLCRQLCSLISHRPRLPTSKSLPTAECKGQAWRKCVCRDQAAHMLDPSAVKVQATRRAHITPAAQTGQHDGQLLSQATDHSAKLGYPLGASGLRKEPWQPAKLLAKFRRHVQFLTQTTMLAKTVAPAGGERRN